jgi:elongation factor P hydroxylase
VTTREDLAHRCETIEQAYEFMLAYAAQYAALVESDELEPREKYAAFLQVLGRDAADALAAIELVLAQRSISSQLVDNLNASMHIRALLTDIFLIDEVLKSQTTEPAQTSKP